MSTTNRAEAPPEARVVRFTTDDAPPEPAGPLPRLPRDGEAHGDYLVAIGKTIGILDNAASLTAARKAQLAAEMLDRCRTDEIYGGGRLSRQLLAADRCWRLQNPEIQGIGDAAASSRDLAGRAVRGPARAVALTLEGLTADDPRPLTAPEEELLRSLAPAVADALDDQRTVAAAAAEAVLQAVHAAQVTYPAGEPGLPVRRETA